MEQKIDYSYTKFFLVSVLSGGIANSLTTAYRVFSSDQPATLESFSAIGGVAAGGLAAIAIYENAKKNQLSSSKTAARSVAAYTVVALASLSAMMHANDIQQSFHDEKNNIITCMKNVKQTAQDGLEQTTYWVGRGMPGYR